MPFELLRLKDLECIVTEINRQRLAVKLLACAIYSEIGFVIIARTACIC